MRQGMTLIETVVVLSLITLVIAYAAQQLWLQKGLVSLPARAVYAAITVFVPLNLALLKGAAVVGVFWGDFARREPKRFAASVGQLTKWFGEGRLKPHVSQTLPRAKAAEALKIMAARQVKGKLVLTVG